MNKALWLIQILLAVFFFVTGVIHFVLPAGLPQQMSWMYDLSTPLHLFSGGAEILGALGLVLPALTRTQTRLVPLAALGLTVVMLSAVIFHVMRGEYSNIIMNTILGLLCAFVAFGRWQLAPFTDSKSASPI
jgi:uncharacterized membrane protein